MATSEHVSDAQEQAQSQDGGYHNVSRDEATLGQHRDRATALPGLANEDQPAWRPPESQPEPRPLDPILDQTPPTPNTINSPT